MTSSSLSDQAQGRTPFYLSLAVHPGTLCKANMATACARTLSKVGWSLLESPVARRSGILSCYVGNITSHGFGRTYVTARTAVRTKLLSSLRGGRGRFLGCAFLLGGGLGFYQTVKFGVHQHLAQEESKVRLSGLGRQEYSILTTVIVCVITLGALESGSAGTRVWQL